MVLRKPAHLLPKLGILLVLGLLLGIWYWLDLPCVFRWFTGIPCITCGMTRAWLAAFRLELSVAFRQHPMFWSIPVIVLYFLCDGKVFANPKANIRIPLSIVAGLLLCWLARVFGFSGSLLPL